MTRRAYHRAYYAAHRDRRQMQRRRSKVSQRWLRWLVLEVLA